MGTFDQILTYMGFSLGIFPILVAAGVFKLRRSEGGGHRMPGFPAAPLVYIASGIAILGLAFLERPGISSIALGTAAMGIPAYYIFERKRRVTAGRSERFPT
jgi:APA family basic amino acid/polyamine antiporter